MTYNTNIINIQYALDNREHVFITGPRSYGNDDIDKLIKDLHKYHNTVPLSTNGISADHIDGKTYHSYIGNVEINDVDILDEPCRIRRLKNMKYSIKTWLIDHIDNTYNILDVFDKYIMTDDILDVFDKYIMTDDIRNQSIEELLAKIYVTDPWIIDIFKHFYKDRHHYD